MLRVALLIDDYNELTRLQFFLRKIGIDVEAAQSPSRYEEISLGFNPQILILTGIGKKVNGLKFAEELHRVRGLPKVLVILESSQEVSAEQLYRSQIDGVLTSPYQPEELVVALCDLSTADEQTLLDKLKKIQLQGETGFEPQGPTFVVSSSSPESTESPKYSFRLHERSSMSENIAPEVHFDLPSEPATLESKKIDAQYELRQQRTQKFMQKIKPLVDPQATSYQREKILALNKKIRNQPPAEDIQTIEKDRKDFVRLLFQNKKSQS